MTPEQLLREGLAVYGLPADAAAIEGLEEFSRRLLERNQVMNLTAITDPCDVAALHLLDCAYLLTAADFRGKSVVDVGTGAGFPGIPLKIAFPDLRMTLADSLNKRILFLQEVIEELGLKDIEAIHARAEELGKNKEYREKFDLVVSSAVANLSSLEEYCVPFVKIGGNFISYKSGEIEEEVANAKNATFLLGGKMKEVYKFDLYEQKRSFVVIDKVKGTPKTYPRKAGTPLREPLA